LLPHLAHLDAQAALALSIFLLTFAYEDAATLLVVTLGTAGRLDPRLGLTSAVLGIWTGDLGLYLLGAKFGGKFGAKIGGKFDRSGWMKRFLSPESFSNARSWFERRGTLTIVLSRFIPGSRLPLYVAAGALKQPPRIFASVTGLCAVVWVTAIFAASHFTTIARLTSGRSVVLLPVSVLVGSWLLARLRRDVFPRIRLIWRKYRRWEFWPAWMFYPPVAAMCAWLSVKYRGLALPTIANPAFRNGGIIGESKIDILRALMGAAPDWVADGYLLPAAPLPQRMHEFQRVCREQEFSIRLC